MVTIMVHIAFKEIEKARENKLPVSADYKYFDTSETGASSTGIRCKLMPFPCRPLTHNSPPHATPWSQNGGKGSMMFSMVLF
jgi:hypothetical protein